MNKFKLRHPDVVIGNDYMLRWYVIPKNTYFNIYLHEFRHSDDDRALHDHPWYSLSFLLKGELKEHSDNGVRFVKRLLPVFRTAKFAHRLELVKGPAWTIFITGPEIREWGFYCLNGWKHWEDLTDGSGNFIDDGVSKNEKQYLAKYRKEIT